MASKVPPAVPAFVPLFISTSFCFSMRGKLAYCANHTTSQQCIPSIHYQHRWQHYRGSNNACPHPCQHQSNIAEFPEIKINLFFFLRLFFGDYLPAIRYVSIKTDVKDLQQLISDSLLIFYTSSSLFQAALPEG